MKTRNQPNRRTTSRPRRPTRYRTAVASRSFLLATLLMASAAMAQAEPPGRKPPGTASDVNLIAIHYEDLLATEPDTVTVILPPPQVDGPLEATYSADGCLRLEGTFSGRSDQAIALELRAPEIGSCLTRIDIVFRQGDERWPATVLVNLTRLPPVPELEGPTPTFQTGSTSLPWTPDTSRLQTAGTLLLGIDNPLSQPLTILGLGDDAGFADVIGPAFRYDPATFDGSYGSLLEHAEPFTPTTLAPGESAHLALVFDPSPRLPSGAGAVTVRPVARVEVAGERFTLAFPRISSSWGVDLP